jgi:hypothetical protein
MGSVTINFLGVCTIFKDLPKYVPDEFKDVAPNNRVVLARATDAFVRMAGVDPHIAKLQVPGDPLPVNALPLRPVEGEENTYYLEGVELMIQNATDTVLGPERGLDCLPSLSTFLKGPLGAPARGVYVPDPENVQAWFSVQGGVAQAYVMNVFPPCSTVPSITVLTMTTDGPPVLQCQPWGAAEPASIEFPNDNVRIDVMNFAWGQGVVDDDRDFLLNYTLIEPFPRITDVEIPRANACTIKSPGQFKLPRCGDAGPGCSNTNYP